MSARILSGKAIAEEIKQEVAAEAATFSKTRGFSPCLVAIRVGDDPASSVYVASKVRTAGEVGLISEHHHLPSNVSEEKLAEMVRQLDQRGDVDGILVQLPLPKHIDERRILELVHPSKDIDGFHPINAGRLMQGHDTLIPCTPAGVIEILKRSNIDVAGKNAVVVGRSNIVGKPMALLLLRENATVTICHSHTRDLPSITRQADILIAAIGRAGYIRGEHIAEGATVIDVGINSISDKEFARELFADEDIEKRLEAIDKRGFTLVGDVNPKEAMQRAGIITPVPGGVGLLTVAMLMKNTLKAAIMRRKT